MFAFVVCSTILVLDYVITRGLRRDHQTNISVWNDIYEGKVKSDIVVLGSSRAVYHIDPFILSDSLKSSAYNLGMDGQMFEFQYCRFKVFMKHNPPPKVILQVVECSTLNKAEGIYDYQQFLPFLDDTTLSNTLKQFKGIDRNDYFVPMSRYAGEFKLINHSMKMLFSDDNKNPNRRNGFEGQYRTWNNDFTNVRKKYKKRVMYKVDMGVVKQFEEYLQFCKQKNIKVIMVYTPEYIEGQRIIVGRENFIALYERLSDKYDVPFLNYSGSELSYNRDMFYNALHLNIQGAQAFSCQLSADLKKIDVLGGQNTKLAQNN